MIPSTFNLVLVNYTLYQYLAAAIVSNTCLI